MEEEIKEEFRRNGFSLDEEEEILMKCLTFCVNYKLTPSALAKSWEIYYLNRQLNEAVVQNAEMDGFLSHLQNEQRETVLKDEGNLHVYSIHDVDGILSNGHEDMREDIIGTPDRSEYHLSEPGYSTHHTDGYHTSAKSSELVTPFGQRKNKFVVQSTGSDLPSNQNTKTGLNDENHSNQNTKTGDNDENHEDDIIRRVQPSERCSVLVHGSRPESGCRFMYDRIEDRFNFLEDRIGKQAKAFVSSGLCEEPMDPTVASQKSVFAVGMICCAGEGRLNESSILFQSSVEHSGGQLVRLDLQKLSQFSIFPGQVLGIEGNNPSGHCLIASKIIDSIPLSVSGDANLRPTKKQAMDQEFQSTDPSHKMAQLSAIIAAGPFTTNDNLLFEPLSELLAYASRQLPQLLILLGPFVDSEHPEVKEGAIDRSFEEIFRLEILRRLQDHVEYMGSAARVILVPSIRDANHDFVFPQPAFDIQPIDLKYQMTSVTNPGIFEANEMLSVNENMGVSSVDSHEFQVKVGCCTVDILKHLSGEVVSRKPADGSLWDGRGRLAQHILGQRSFYPLYPPAEDIPLDLSLAPEALDVSPPPDVLILPSDLAPFVKVLSLGGGSEGQEQAKCICLNPGRLAKGEKGGYFVELNYNGSPETSSASIINI